MRGCLKIKAKKNLVMSIVICISIVISLIFPSLSAVYAGESLLTNLNAPLINQTGQLLAKSGSINVRPMENAVNFSNAFISAVQSGSTNISQITVMPSNPIGKIIRIDIRIDNVSSGFWGWVLPTISWDPAVMNLTNVQEGTFLTDNTGASALFIGNSPILWNNTRGEIDGGLAEALSVADTSVDSSGVLATLTFKITNYGTSQVTVEGAYTVASFNQAACSYTNVNCINATIDVLSNNSLPLAFPTWIIAPIVMIPLFGLLAYAWKKKTAKTPPNAMHP
jgi:hypothetical protein